MVKSPARSRLYTMIGRWTGQAETPAAFDEVNEVAGTGTRRPSARSAECE
jgi:hypothetical protein